MILELGQFKFTGVTKEEFSDLDKAVAEQYTSKQAGFVKRSSGYDADKGMWMFIAHWEDMGSAQGSMAGFMDSPLTADFRDKIVFESFTTGVFEETTFIELS